MSSEPTAISMSDLMTNDYSRTPVFLETSIQVVRHFDVRERRWMVEQLLSERPVYTSSTVFREFHASMLTAFQHVADVLRDVESDGLIRFADIARYVASKPGLYGERQAKRILYVVAHIGDVLNPQEEHSPVDLADFCEAEIERFRRQRFFRVGVPARRRDVRATGGYIDTVRCSVAEDPADPSKPLARRISCDKQTRQCSVRELLRSARECIAGLPVEWRQRRPNIALVADKVASWTSQEFSGTTAVGQAVCWPLGDLVIAHECPEEALIMTSDRDFLYIVPLNAPRSVLLIRPGD